MLKIGVYAFVEFSYQGFTTRVVNIINRLSESNKIVVYGPSSSNINAHKSELSLHRSITIQRFPFATKLYNEPKVYQFLKKEYAKGNFDVLQVENIYGTYFLTSKCDFPVVGVFHGRLHEEHSYSKQLLLSQGKTKEFLHLLPYDSYTYLCEKKLAKKADSIIVPSELVREYTIKLGANPKKIFVLPNGIDIKEYREFSHSTNKRKLRKELHVPEDAFVFVFHGSLDWDQNIEAVKNVIKIRDWFSEHDSSKGYFFLIVGGPASRLESFLKEKRSNVYITDYVPDVKPYLFLADCGLAPFPEDVKPGGPRLKILELLAAGLPLITTKTGISGFEELSDDFPIYLIQRNMKSLLEFLYNLPPETNIEKLRRFDWTQIALNNEEILKHAVLTRSPPV
jgi:glycosyltransferase involved in cell wall biosynthesis